MTQAPAIDARTGADYPELWNRFPPRGRSCDCIPEVVRKEGCDGRRTRGSKNDATEIRADVANVFRAPGEFGLEQMPVPTAGPGEAVIKVRRTTICGTDVHIVKGEYAVAPGLIIGHEATGVIHEPAAGVDGYRVGQRVIAGAITPCGQCEF